MKIYDYANKAVEVDTQGKEIDHIHVTVLSGDEIVTVYFQDGTKIRKDSSNCRVQSFYDGEYDVDKENLKKWQNFKFVDTEFSTRAYSRMRAFDDCSDDD